MIIKDLIKRLSLFSLIMLSLYGCANPIMKPSLPVSSVNNNKALVTFLPSKWVVVSNGPYGRQYNASAKFDLWDSDNFIGALSAETYFQYAADPGEHLFIARGGNWSFVKANLQSGKRYYVILTTYPLPFRGQIVDLQPVKIGDKKFMADIQASINDLKPMSVIQENYDNYIKKKINEVRNEISVFKSTDYGFSLLDAQDGI